VALATFRQKGDKAEQAAAVAHLERALDHWRDLTIAGTQYNVPRMPHNPNELFSWARFLPSVERDIAIARGTATVDTPPRSMPVAEPIRPIRP
jgi:hypothetical protein